MVVFDIDKQTWRHFSQDSQRLCLFFLSFSLLNLIWTILLKWIFGRMLICLYMNQCCLFDWQTFFYFFFVLIFFTDFKLMKQYCWFPASGNEQTMSKSFSCCFIFVVTQIPLSQFENAFVWYCIRTELNEIYMHLTEIGRIYVQ